MGRRDGNGKVPAGGSIPKIPLLCLPLWTEYEVAEESISPTDTDGVSALVLRLRIAAVHCSATTVGRRRIKKASAVVCAPRIPAYRHGVQFIYLRPEAVDGPGQAGGEHGGGGLCGGVRFQKPRCRTVFRRVGFVRLGLDAQPSRVSTAVSTAVSMCPDMESWTSPPLLSA